MDSTRFARNVTAREKRMRGVPVEGSSTVPEVQRLTAARTDNALDALNEARDHVEIQIPLLDDAEMPDRLRLKALAQFAGILRQS